MKGPHTPLDTLLREGIINDDVKRTSVSNSINSAARFAKTYDDWCLFAALYTTGFDSVIKTNEVKAITCYKLAYTAAAVDHNKSLHFYKNELKKIAGKEDLESNYRRKALLQIFHDLINKESEPRKHAALMMLTRIYAYGKYGVAPDTNALIKICRKGYDILPEPEDKQRFLERTELASLLTKEEHITARTVILAFIFASTVLLPLPTLMSYYQLILEKQDPSQQHPDYFEHRRLLVNGGIRYAMAHVSIYVALFFARLALQHFIASGCDCSANFPALIMAETALEGLHHIFFKRSMDVTTPAFFRGDSPSKLLRDTLSTLINEHGTHLKESGAGVLSLCKNASALLTIFMDSSFTKESFHTGIQQLIALNDAKSVSILKNIGEQALMHLHGDQTLAADPLEKLKLFFVIIELYVAVNSPIVALTTFRQAMVHVRRHALYSSYEDYWRSKDPEIEYKKLLLTNPDPDIDLSRTLNWTVCLSGHYKMLSAALPHEKDILAQKIDALYQKSIHDHPFLTHIYFAFEFGKGSLFPHYPEQCKKCIISAQEIAQTRTLTPFEHTRYVFFLDEIIKLCKTGVIKDTEFQEHLVLLKGCRLLLEPKKETIASNLKG